MWCHRSLLKIKWTEMISNKEVLQRMKEKEMHLYNSIVKQKMAYAGHVLHVDPVVTVHFKSWKEKLKVNCSKIEDPDVCG